MSENRIHASHPSFNESLLSASPERAVAAFVECGDLSVDELGRVWRHRRKVGGNHPRMADLDTPVRAENILPSGRHQIQIYVLGKRVLCLAARLVWYLKSGEIPDGHHIHHRNKDYRDNRLENLECVHGPEHLSTHSTGRSPPNKCTLYGETEAGKKAAEGRRKRYAEKCEITHSLLQSGLSLPDVATLLGICEKQVSSRLKTYSVIRAHQE